MFVGVVEAFPSLPRCAPSFPLPTNYFYWPLKHPSRRPRLCWPLLADKNDPKVRVPAPELGSMNPGHATLQMSLRPDPARTPQDSPYMLSSSRISLYSTKFSCIASSTKQKLSQVFSERLHRGPPTIGSLGTVEISFRASVQCTNGRSSVHSSSSAWGQWMEGERQLRVMGLHGGCIS